MPIENVGASKRHVNVGACRCVAAASRRTHGSFPGQKNRAGGNAARARQSRLREICLDSLTSLTWSLDRWRAITLWVRSALELSRVLDPFRTSAGNQHKGYRSRLTRNGHRLIEILHRSRLLLHGVCRPPRRRAFGLSCRGSARSFSARSRRLMAGVGPGAALRLTGSSR
jgi:hypothetical protein